MSGDRNEPVYRPHTGGMDEGTKRLALIASGIGFFLLVVVGGWSLGGRHGGSGGGDIPVIGPDPGPIKIKPANPGGLQLTGAEPPPANDDNGHGPSLAPGPEKPDPAALQAELDAARRAEAPAPKPAPPAAAPALPAAVVPPGTAAPARLAAAVPPGSASTPPSPASAPAPHPVALPPAPSAGAAPAPAATAPPPVASAAPQAPAAPAPSSLAAAMASLRAAPAAGRIAVQLAAVDTEAEAHAQWSRLAHTHPGLLDGRAPLVIPAQRDGHTFYRLRTGGFTTVAAAASFCTQLRAAGAACTVATF